MIEVADPHQIWIRHKAITALFPYAAKQGQSGQNRLLDILLDSARASKRQGFMWHRIGPPITMLLNKENPIFLRQAIILISPHLPWWDPAINAHFVQLCVRTDLANRPTEPMLVSFRARYTKLWGNRGFLQSGSRQTTPVRVGVTCGSGISVVRVGRE